MDNLMFSLNATLPVFLVMVIGWALGQKGFLPKQFCTVADKLVFKVTLPVMLFWKDRARFYSYLHRVWSKTSDKPVWMEQAEEAACDFY